VEKWHLDAPREHPGAGFAIFTVTEGRVACGAREFGRGSFFLLPAGSSARQLVPLTPGASVLRTTIPGQG